jgi:iron complex outermembrane receptor protein
MKIPAAVSCFLLAASFAAAQPPSNLALRELSLEQLGSLEITTVSKQPEEVWRSAAAVAVLTQDDIRRSGARTLPDLLRLVPGVQVSQLDADHWAVGIRGLASAFSKSLLVLIDGRSVYTPLFGGVFWDVQDTLIEDIERIEVIRGPGGTIWGSNAVNGVINIVTRSSKDTTGVLAVAGGGNLDHGEAGFRFGGTSGDRLSYRFYGKGFVRGGEQPGENPFDDWNMGRAGFRTDVTPRDGDTLTLQGDIYKGSSGDLIGVGSFAPPEQRILEGANDISGGNLMARWERTSPNGAGYRVQAYYDRTAREALHYSETRNTFDVDFLHHSPVGRRHDLSWGAGARVSPSDFTPFYQTLTFSPEDSTHRTFTAFAQDEMALVPETLWLTVGSKFEHNNFSGLEIQPSVKLLWHRNERETLWTSVSRAVRTPSRIDTDLRLTVFGVTDPVLAYLGVDGVENFEAESLIGVEAGYRRLIVPTLYLDVAGFHNNYDKLAGYGTFDITVETDPVPYLRFAVPYENAIRGTTDGFEIAPDWKPLSWWQLKGAYSFLKINMRARSGHNSDENNIALYEGSSPRHQLFVRSSFSLPRGLEFDQTYRFASRLVSHDIPHYQTADLRLEWTASDRLTLSVTGRDLLQSDHPEFFRDDILPIGVRRSVFAAVTWRH